MLFVKVTSSTIIFRKPSVLEVVLFTLWCYLHPIPCVKLHVDVPSMAIPPNNTADARSSNQAAKGNGAVAKGNAGDKPRSTPSATKQPLVTLATIMPWLDPHAGWVDAPLPVRPAWGIPKSTTAGSEQPVRRVSLESPTPTHEGDASEKLQSPKQHLHASEPDTCVQLTDVERKLEVKLLQQPTPQHPPSDVSYLTSVRLFLLSFQRNPRTPPQRLAIYRKL